MTAFREAFSKFDLIYVLIDALDEFSDLKTLLKQLAALQQWHTPQLRLLCTSQPHSHQVNATVHDLSIPDFNRVNVAEHGGDIVTYIDRFLQESVDLRKLIPDFPDVYKDIRRTLLAQADNSSVLHSLTIT
jgi:hypothetical protein